MAIALIARISADLYPRQHWLTTAKQKEKSISYAAAMLRGERKGFIMIISTTSIGRHDAVGGGALRRLAAGAQRLWLAYVTWRIERLAIVELRSMNDHELNDLGLPRSEIAGAVKAGRHASLGFALPPGNQPRTHDSSSTSTGRSEARAGRHVSSVTVVRTRHIIL